MDSFTIRRARPGDSGSICRVHKTSITELCGGHYDPGQIEAWAGPKKPEDYERAMRELEVFVAEAEKQVVGFSMLNPRTGEIHALYVDPDHVRRGAGTGLLEAVEARARAAGLSKVDLNGTLNSVSFYEARGFRSLRRTTNTLPGGIDLPCVRMEKRL